MSSSFCQLIHSIHFESSDLNSSINNYLNISPEPSSQSYLSKLEEKINKIVKKERRLGRKQKEMEQIEKQRAKIYVRPFEMLLNKEESKIIENEKIITPIKYAKTMDYLQTFKRRNKNFNRKKVFLLFELENSKNIYKTPVKRVINCEEGCNIIKKIKTE